MSRFLVNNFCTYCSNLVLPTRAWINQSQSVSQTDRQTDRQTDSQSISQTVNQSIKLYLKRVTPISYKTSEMCL